jgi:hypothetical protein
MGLAFPGLRADVVTSDTADDLDVSVIYNLVFATVVHSA